MSVEPPFGVFLDEVEKHNAKTLRHKDAVGRFLDAARTPALRQVFADAVFHATFVVKTRDVMQRIGHGAEGFDTLSTQFSEGLERVSSLLRTLVKEEPEEVKRDLTGKFFSMDQDSLSRLLELLADLALIKHWQVDGHPLPFGETEPPKQSRSAVVPDPGPRLRNLTRTARLALLLLIVVLILDGPFTVLGWIISVLVAGLLFIVQFEGAAAQKDMS